MNNDDMKALNAAIEGCGWLEAKKIAVACHVLSARLGKLSRGQDQRLHQAHTDQLSEEFNALAVRAELVLDEKISDKGLDIQD